MNNPAWTWFAITFQCVYAYIVALIIYQVGTFAATGQFTFGTVCGLGAILLLIYLLGRKNPYKA